MKLEIDTVNDILYLTFSDNKIIDSVLLNDKITSYIDNNKKIVSLKVESYSVLRNSANELLAEEDLLSLQDYEIVFYIKDDYEIAFFRLEDVNKEDILCNYCIIVEGIDRTFLKEFIQHEIDYKLSHKKIHCKL